MHNLICSPILLDLFHSWTSCSFEKRSLWIYIHNVSLIVRIRHLLSFVDSCGCFVHKGETHLSFLISQKSSAKKTMKDSNRNYVKYMLEEYENTTNLLLKISCSFSYCTCISASLVSCCSFFWRASHTYNWFILYSSFAERILTKTRDECFKVNLL